jgi:hypothetical protein
MEFPMGLKSPLIPEGAPVYINADLSAAIEALRSELSDLKEYYRTNAHATRTHPRLGTLDYKEWLVFHNKHFTHHFKQFGLL